MAKQNRGNGAVAAIRIAAGYTQMKAAAALDITQSYLARIEGGYHDPSMSLVSGMAQLYRAEVADMIRAVERARRLRARLQARLEGSAA